MGQQHDAHPEEPDGHRSELGGLLRKTRLDLGLSQQQVADRVGSNRASVSRWENASKLPKVQARFRGPIAAFIGVERSVVDRLIGGVETRRTDGGDIVPIRPEDSDWATPRRSPSPLHSTELQESFVRASIKALGRGDASSDEWRRSARAIADLVGLGFDTARDI